MHIPDGFIDGQVSAAAGLVAIGGVGVCLRRSTIDLADEHAPLAGAVAAFVFAGQMLNFPVAGGTSGHLLGAALATVLVGPWLAVVCITSVLLVQGLLFADGGLSAVGLNVVNMALVAVLVAHVAIRSLARFGPVAAATGAALVSVPAAACAFALEYALGGTGSASPDTVLSAMLGVHLVIGVGEAVITGLTVGAVVASRPDLVRVGAATT